MRRFGSLRARITVAAVVALALGGLIGGGLLLAGVQRDGRSAVDDDLRSRADGLLRRAGGFGGGPGGLGGGSGGGGGPGGPGRRERDEGDARRLLAGSGTFAQLAVSGEVIEQQGDVPEDPPDVPSRDGFSTVGIDGKSWRSLTVTVDPVRDIRFEVLRSLKPVEEQVEDTSRLVLILGGLALVITGLAAWLFTGVAVRPLARLGEGAARVSGAEDLGTPLPEDDGPDEVRSLARALNAMLARLGASTDALERALHATRRFTADAGHELRTPLTGIRANLDTLARNPDLPLSQRQALVAETTAEQERTIHLLEGLQALARGEAADTLPREDVELGDLVDAALHDARRRHPAVTYELAEDIGGAAVHGWPSGLRLMVDNVLDNAALHGRQGGRVAVALERDRQALVMRIEDDGPGIPTTDRDRLLEPFTRGEATAAPGTGLGLAIVVQQVTLHGGTLRLDVADRGGLRVEIRLPAA